MSMAFLDRQEKYNQSDLTRSVNIEGEKKLESMDDKGERAFNGSNSCSDVLERASCISEKKKKRECKGVAYAIL